MTELHAEVAVEGLHDPDEADGNWNGCDCDDNEIEDPRDKPFPERSVTKHGLLRDGSERHGCPGRIGYGSVHRGVTGLDIEG